LSIDANRTAAIERDVENPFSKNVGWSAEGDPAEERERRNFRIELPWAIQ
jgi:hypothetical protein